jgi:hypothetical protein
MCVDNGNRGVPQFEREYISTDSREIYRIDKIRGEVRKSRKMRYSQVIGRGKGVIGFNSDVDATDAQKLRNKAIYISTRLCRITVFNFSGCFESVEYLRYRIWRKF